MDPSPDSRLHAVGELHGDGCPGSAYPPTDQADNQDGTSGRNAGNLLSNVRIELMPLEPEWMELMLEV